MDSFPSFPHTKKDGMIWVDGADSRKCGRIECGMGISKAEDGTGISNFADAGRFSEVDMPMKELAISPARVGNRTGALPLA